MAFRGTSDPGAPRRTREIFISAVHFDEAFKAGTRSVLDLAPLAVSLGVQGVEYRDVYWKEKDRELPAVKAQLAQLKLKATYTTVTPMYAAEAAKHRQLLQDIDDARALGSPLLRVTLGERPPKGKATTVIHYAARQAVEWAAGRRIQLSLENNAKAPGEKLAGIHETLQDFDCRYLGTNIDFANYVANDQDPLQAIRTLTRWINYVHAKDARKTPEGWKSTPLGDGSLPLQEIVAALDATQRRFAFCFEFPGDTDPEGAIRKSLEFMARLDA